MESEFRKLRKSDKDSAPIAASCLSRALVVVIPTDTVYGFSAVEGKETEERIRRIKGRDDGKPFIKLAASVDDIVERTDGIPRALLDKWPGALTVIARDKSGGGSCAWRCPGDEWLREVIALCGRPIFSTSVNKSGFPPLSSVAEMEAAFARDVALIVDDGDKKGALPSTIVRATGGEIEVLRQGETRL